MSLSIAFLILLIVTAIILFACDRIPIDFTAILILIALLFTGIVTPEQGLQGFSNPATVTIAAMFILSAGLFKTGVINALTTLLYKTGKQNYWLTLILLILLVGFISAFINNTAAVAIFLPIVISISHNLKVSPSKFLIPLSFASMFGGVCTLIGTSTNLLISSIAKDHGYEPFKMFEFTQVGFILFLVGAIYLIFASKFLIPSRRPVEDQLSKDYGLDNYITEIVLVQGAGAHGKQLKDWDFISENKIDVLELIRDGISFGLPNADTILHRNDVLRVSAPLEDIQKFDHSSKVQIHPGTEWRDQTERSGCVLVEAVIAPNSRLDGKSIIQSGLRERHSCTVLAMRKRGTLFHKNFKSRPLVGGDSLLIEIKKERLSQLKYDPAFVITSEIDLPKFRTGKAILGIAIVGAVVLSAALNILPIVVSAIAGCILMIMTGCLTLEEAYAAIEWRVIVLIAGVLSLSIALENTGTTTLIADFFQHYGNMLSPFSLLGILIFFTIVTTDIISNAATAVLLAPIAIVLAESMGVSARPFLMGVTFASSLSFMTPIGYQTNAMIYGPGQYKFTDFLKIGAPLNLITALLLTYLIPHFWPF